MNACGDMAFAFAQIDIWCINALHSFLLHCNSSSLFSSDMKKYRKMKAQNVYRIINVIYNTSSNGMRPLGWKERANRAHKTVLSVIEFVGKKIHHQHRFTAIGNMCAQCSVIEANICDLIIPFGTLWIFSKIWIKHFMIAEAMEAFNVSIQSHCFIQKSIQA